MVKVSLEEVEPDVVVVEWQYEWVKSLLLISEERLCLKEDRQIWISILGIFRMIAWSFSQMAFGYL